MNSKYSIINMTNFDNVNLEILSEWFANINQTSFIPENDIDSNNDTNDIEDLKNIFDEISIHNEYFDKIRKGEINPVDYIKFDSEEKEEIEESKKDYGYYEGTREFKTDREYYGIDDLDVGFVDVEIDEHYFSDDDSDEDTEQSQEDDETTQEYYKRSRQWNYL